MALRCSIPALFWDVLNQPNVRNSLVHRGDLQRALKEAEGALEAYADDSSRKACEAAAHGAVAQVRKARNEVELAISELLGKRSKKWDGSRLQSGTDLVNFGHVDSMYSPIPSQCSCVASRMTSRRRECSCPSRAPPASLPIPSTHACADPSHRTEDRDMMEKKIGPPKKDAH